MTVETPPSGESTETTEAEIEAVEVEETEAEAVEVEESAERSAADQPDDDQGIVVTLDARADSRQVAKEIARAATKHAARKPRQRAVPMTPEVRHWSITDRLEVRSAEDGADEILISGIPIVYNEPYTVMDMFGEFEERMLPGVARNVLQSDVRFLFNHEGMPLARTTSGTLQLQDGDSELRFVARLDARQQLATDLAIAIERGDVNQMSVGFIPAQDEWNDALDQRSVKLFAEMPDISAVTYPCSPTTHIQVAQRMVSDVPVESRARLRKIYTELRAGKVLSQGNQDMLVNAATALHQVLDSAGWMSEPEPEPEPVADAVAEAVEEPQAAGEFAQAAEEAAEDDGQEERAQRAQHVRRVKLELERDRLRLRKAA